MKPVVMLYIIGTFCASLVGVTMSFLFPTTLTLQVAPDTQLAPPSGIIQVLHNLILSVVDNPVAALMNANYIGILAWAIIFGIALKSMGSGTTKTCLNDIAAAITKVVTWVIHFAPLGIMGLVAESVGTAGLGALIGYVQLLGVLIGSYFIVALVMNPAIVFARLHVNPYPLVLTTLRESGVYAFFTRSSAANIPVNLTLCRRLGLNPDLFTISIPLGATINMAGSTSSVPCRNRRRLRRFRRSRGLAPSDSGCLRIFRYRQRHFHAGRRRRLHHFCTGRCLRNGSQQLFRRSLHSYG